MQKIFTIKFLQKQKPRRKDCIQATGFLNKERNFDGESVLCTEEMLFPHLLYIVYQIFRRAQIFVGFSFGQQKTRKSVRLSCCVASAVLDSDNVSAV